MNLYGLYQLVNIVANKDRSGLIDPQDFNVLLPAETRNYIDYLLRFYERDEKIRRQFEPFTDESTSIAVPVILSDRVRYAKHNEIRTLEGKIIPVVDRGSWYSYIDSFIKKPTESNPIARVIRDKIEIKPDTISYVDITYIRYPKDPYMDGYVDGDDNFVFLGEGESVDLDTTTGTALDGTSSGTYNSQTIPLSFNDEGKLEIAARILGDMGIAYSKQALVQYSQMMKTED